MPAIRPLDYAGPRRNFANRRVARFGPVFFYALAGLGGLVAVLSLIGIAVFPLLVNRDDEVRIVFMTLGLGMALLVSMSVCHAAYQTARDRVDR